MASKRPRKLKSSLRIGSKAARSSRSRVKRATPPKKKPTAAKRAAPKRAAKPPSAPATPTLPAHAPSLERSRALPRAELLAQAKAAGIGRRHRMTTVKLRAVLTRLGDQPAAAAASSHGGLRLSAAAAPPPVAGLPWRYGVTELVAMPVDPVLVHVYWELATDAVAALHARLGAGWDRASQVLRAYDVAGVPPDNGDHDALVARARHRFDFDVSGDVGNYYIHLWSPNQTLIFEIGWRAQDGRFAAAARSNRIATPRNAPAETSTERWMTVRDGRIVSTTHDAISRTAGTDGGHEPSDAAPWSGAFQEQEGPP